MRKLALTPKAKKYILVALVAILAFSTASAVVSLAGHPSTPTSKTSTKIIEVEGSGGVLAKVKQQQAVIANNPYRDYSTGVAKDGFDCLYFGQYVGYVPTQKYCDAILTGVKSPSYPPQSNQPQTTVCRNGSVVFGIVREPYMCEQIRIVFQRGEL